MTTPQRGHQTRLIPSISKAMSHLWPANQRTSRAVPLCRVSVFLVLRACYDLERRSFQMCKMKPVFIESGRAHDYCSRTCASDYEGRKLQACLLEDCKLTGRSAHADFCSDQHAKYVPVRKRCATLTSKRFRDGVRKGQVAGCLTCGIYPQASQNGQCVSCQRQPSASPAPRSTNSDRLEEVKAGSSEFKRGEETVYMDQT